MMSLCCRGEHLVAAFKKDILLALGQVVIKEDVVTNKGTHTADSYTLIVRFKVLYGLGPIIHRHEIKD